MRRMEQIDKTTRAVISRLLYPLPIAYSLSSRGGGRLYSLRPCAS